MFLMGLLKQRVQFLLGASEGTNPLFCQTVNRLRQSSGTQQTKAQVSFHLIPNYPKCLVHVLIVRLMTFRAAFCVFTVLSS